MEQHKSPKKIEEKDTKLNKTLNNSRNSNGFNVSKAYTQERNSYPWKNNGSRKYSNGEEEDTMNN